MKKFFLSLLIVSLFASSTVAQRGVSTDARKLQLALYAISNLYVDSISEKKLVEDAITGMLEKLDPHSAYSDPEETKEMNEPLQGNFDGIGIQFNMLTDTLYVIQVIPGGPSEKVGIMRRLAAVGVLLPTASLPVIAEDKPSAFSKRGSFERLSMSYATINIGLEKPFSIMMIIYYINTRNNILIRISFTACTINS